MKTIELTRDQMLARVARFARLEPLAAQIDPSIPPAAKDLVYSRKLLSVIDLDGSATLVSAGAPIHGAAGMTIVTGTADGTINNDDGVKTRGAQPSEDDEAASAVAIADPIWLFAPADELTSDQLRQLSYEITAFLQS